MTFVFHQSNLTLIGPLLFMAAVVLHRAVTIVRKEHFLSPSRNTTWLEISAGFLLCRDRSTVIA